jgi:DNA-binding response OmpR family regulator
VPRGRPSERILVVEDDPDVRSYTVSSLRELGYAVMEAGDATSALRLLDAGPRFDLLFTDLGLPGGQNGKALAEAARKRDPSLKVLMTTAYAGAALIHKGRLDPGIDLLSKPFAYKALALRVRAVLDRHTRPEAAS